MELRNYRSRRVAGAVVNDNDYDESRRHHIYACHPSLVSLGLLFVSCFHYYVFIFILAQ